MINRIKRDFMSVRSAHVYFLSWMPLWLSVIIYILMAPIGLILYPFGMLWLRMTLGKKDYKQFKEMKRKINKYGREYYENEYWTDLEKIGE